MKTDTNRPTRGEQSLFVLEKFTVGFSAAIIFVMMAVVVYGVILRYVLNAPVSWVAEITEFMMVALTFLVLAHIQDRKGHVRISFLIIRLSKRTQLVLGIITALCALAIFALVTWSSWEYALKALKFGFRTDESEFHLFPPRVLVPIGCFLMCLRLLADVISLVNSLIHSEAGDHIAATTHGATVEEQIPADEVS